MAKSVQIKKIKIGEGIPKICVPITGINYDEIVDQTQHIVERGPDLVEWRADFFENVEDYEQIAEILTTITDKIAPIPLIFTFRTKEEGGERQISLEDYVNLNKMVARTGLTDLVDVEIFKGGLEIIGLIDWIQANGGRVLASNHHFHETPGHEEMLRILKKMDEAGADILKIAVMPKDEEDVLRLLEVTSKMKKMTDKPLITMSMGSLGMPSRVCGEVFGSAVSFASAGRASAPGQLEFDGLETILAIMHDSLQK